MNIAKRTWMIGWLFLLVFSTLRAQFPFQNPNLTVEERLKNLVSLLTLDEKITCLSTNPSIPRLGIKGSGHVEGLHGLAMGGPAKWGQYDGKGNSIPTTIFPQAIGLAETWDPELIKMVGRIEGYEARYIFQNAKYKRGGLVVRAPNADLGRDPRWGRTEECFGEDPYLASRMVVAMIQGLQGDDPHYWLTASLMKHFLANSNETSRTFSSSNFDERLFREYYSYTFFKGISEGKANSFMAAYNSYNGIPCAVNPVLRDVAMKEWGLNGIICTDGGAFKMLVTEHKFSPNFHKAAAQCIKSGINQFLDDYRESVEQALSDHYIFESEIDSAICGSLRIMLKLGLLDPPGIASFSDIGVRDTIDPWTFQKHKDAVRLVTQKSIVLLKNDKEILPLDRRKIQRIAVIGPHAGDVLLDWYSGTPPYTVSPLEGIKQKVGNGVKVSYVYQNNSDSAVIAARTADVAIVCVGNHPTGNAGWAQCPVLSDGKESVDRLSIVLDQEDLIRQVYKANPNTIVVLISSFPYAINWTEEHVPAILHVTHNSQELGNALADVLFGDFNPGGRLVQNWPKSIDQLPELLDYNLSNGHTYMYQKDFPLFPFGFGLSYTTFQYSNFHASSDTLFSNGTIAINVDIKNIGSRKGDEVVQLYVNYPGSGITHPIKELKAFKRITLLPDEITTVKFIINASDLSTWDINSRKFVCNNELAHLVIGNSSIDKKFEQEINIIIKN